MIQGFIEREYESSFAPGSNPRLLSASNIHLDFSHHTRTLHKHNDRCELLFVRYGSSRYVVGNKTFPIKKGDVIINNSGVLHEDLLEKDEELAYYALGIGGLKIEGLDDNHIIVDGICPVIPSGEHYSVFNSIFREIYEFIVTNEPGTEETCHHLMMAAVSLVLHLTETAVPSDEEKDELTLISDLLHYLDENYMQDISLKSISEQFHISSFHLAHVFKEQTGYSPMNYIIRRRIGEAQTLLITTGDSITSIAGRVGFASPNNFNIQFQKQVGLSPRQYRKMYIRDIKKPEKSSKAE